MSSMAWVKQSVLQVTGAESKHSALLAPGLAHKENRLSRLHS